MDRTIPLIATFTLSNVASAAGVKYKRCKEGTKVFFSIYRYAAVQDCNVSDEECQRIATDAEALNEG